MPAFDLAIFDFDGTLADSFPWFLSVLDQTADTFHLKRVNPSDIETLRDHSSREALDKLGVPLWKLPQISNYMRKLATEGLASIPVFPGSAAALRRLHAAGVHLALVSSNSEANVRQVLGEVAAIIDTYDCGASLFGKAGHFRAVLDRTRIARDRAIAIGDELRDIDAARSSGIAIGSVTFGYNSRTSLAAAQPNFLFDNYDQLVGQVAG